MRIVATADLHGALPDISDWPDADVLVLAGDTGFLELGTTHWRGQLEPTLDWLVACREKYAHVLGVAGNHDFGMRDDPKRARRLPWTYLQDEAVEIDGFKFYGTPWSKTFGHWAFMQPDPDLAEVWAKIPDDTDVLIVHGPPYGLVDETWGREHVGSKTLRQRLTVVRPLLTVCGHIHEARGVASFGGRPIANVSWNGKPSEFVIGRV